MAYAVSSKFKEHISDSSMDGMPDDFHLKEELDESEERQGLLSGRTDTPTRESGRYPAQKSDNSSWSWGKMVAVGAAIILLLFASYSGAIYYMRYKTVERAKAMHFDGQTVRSNGTHDFKRTVLIVSIDGLRYVHCSRQSLMEQLRANGSDGQGGLLGERVNPAPVRHQPAGSTSEVHEAYLSGKRHLSFALTRPAHRAHICLDSHLSVSAPCLA